MCFVRRKKQFRVFLSKIKNNLFKNISQNRSRELCARPFSRGRRWNIRRRFHCPPSANRLRKINFKNYFFKFTFRNIKRFDFVYENIVFEMSNPRWMKNLAICDQRLRCGRSPCLCPCLSAILSPRTPLHHRTIPKSKISILHQKQFYCII